MQLVHFLIDVGERPLVRLSEARLAFLYNHRECSCL